MAGSFTGAPWQCPRCIASVPIELRKERGCDLLDATPARPETLTLGGEQYTADRCPGAYRRTEYFQSILEIKATTPVGVPLSDVTGDSPQKFLLLSSLADFDRLSSLIGDGDAS